MIHRIPSAIIRSVIAASAAVLAFSSAGQAWAENPDFVMKEMRDGRGECEPQWESAFTNPGTSQAVFSMVVFDDGLGGGPALYAAGQFSTAGGVSVNHVAKWSGAHWIPLGSGTLNEVNALVVFDDGLGGGPALYAGGDFTLAGGAPASRIAKWNGVAWSALGSGVNGPVYALTVFDDGLGGGPALYAGGAFSMAGGGAASRIAKWNGAAWSAVGSGVDSTIRALTVFNDGSGGGPALYAGGSFTSAGVAASRIAKWNGTAWSALGSGMNNTVWALTTFDDGSGSGPALYAGGSFTTAGGAAANRIAKWNGAAWSSLGSLNGEVRSFATWDDGSGSGPALLVGGSFTTAAGVPANRIAVWDGAVWSALGSGVDNTVRAIALLDDGSGDGPTLWAGGAFQFAGDLRVNYITTWSGDAWQAIGDGVNDDILALTVFDDGSGDGPALYAAGNFSSAGDAVASRIAKWNGLTWSALGSGLGPNDGFCLAVFDDGSGPALHAGGSFITAGGAPALRIAKWNGVAWSAVGGGMSGAVHALAVYDDGLGGGPALYAGGGFASAGGVPGTSRIAKWNGTAWSPLGTGMDNDVRCLAVFDDGSGPALYAGGFFTSASGVPASLIAKWNGTVWSAVGTGVTPTAVYALEVFDDGLGGGPALYAAGSFTTAGGGAADRIAKWDGSSWSALGSGLNNITGALDVYDDGSGDGPALIAGGSFTMAGGVAANRIAKWDGTAWSALGSGTDGTVASLAVFDDGSKSGPALYVGGNFAIAGGASSLHMAKWQGCPVEPECPVYADLNCDGLVNGMDLAIVLGSWGPCEGCPADFNDDGVVDGSDLAIVLGNWTG